MGRHLTTTLTHSDLSGSFSVLDCNKKWHELEHDKTTKSPVCPVKTQISVWASAHSDSVFDVRLKMPWVLGCPLSKQQILRSDWADAQAYLSLCWVPMSFCWFCHIPAHVYKAIVHMPFKACLFVLEFYGPVNNEVMSSRSVNSGTVPGQA